MKVITYALVSAFTVAILYAFTSVSLHPCSVFASLFTLLYAAAFAYCGVWKFSHKKNYSFYKVAKKLSEYLPIALFLAFILQRSGTNEISFLKDALSVSLWCLALLSSQLALFFMNEKRLGKTIPGIEAKKKERSAFSKIIFEALDWADALFQTVFFVLLFQIFFIQLYEIPSESMVPTFLIKDRVAVVKSFSAPKFPLSKIGFPKAGNYKRSDVVVFRNPHYNMDRKSEIKTVVSQLLYMLSLTTININRDENGQIKADPLVKRVCGLPGEQLMMQDGTLYARKAGEEKFRTVKDDEKFAMWNLDSLKEDTKRNVKYIPFSSSQYDLLLKVEKDRREMNMEYAKDKILEMSKAFKRLHAQYTGKKNERKVEIPRLELDLFKNLKEISASLLESSVGVETFDEFFLSWLPTFNTDFGEDLYSKASYRLNIRIKLIAAAILLRFSEMIVYHNSSNEGFSELFQEADALHFYVIIQDQRNMNIFPPNDTDGKACYIPVNSYFMMGDNRFNSLDMRHSYSHKKTALTEKDPFSVEYYSNLAPQSVDEKLILGKPLFTFWPPSRIGSVNRR